MALGLRLGVWCATAVASLASGVCLAAGASDAFVASPTAPLFDTRGSDESLTVAWIARERAIRGYTVRVACAPDRVACRGQEWFVARQSGAELSSYVVRVRVPAGATMVRVGLEAVDEHGRHLPVAERVVPHAPERLGGARRVGPDDPATASACTASASVVAPRPYLFARLGEREPALQRADAHPGAAVPILLSSRGPPPSVLL
jgi:hypothetical protein